MSHLFYFARTEITCKISLFAQLITVAIGRLPPAIRFAKRHLLVVRSRLITPNLLPHGHKYLDQYKIHRAYYSAR